MSSYTREACALPVPCAGIDVLESYAAMLDEDVASFSEQAILDAERGDTEAALYASCVAEFVAIARDRALAYCAEIALNASWL